LILLGAFAHDFGCDAVTPLLFIAISPFSPPLAFATPFTPLRRLIADFFDELLTDDYADV